MVNIVCYFVRRDIVHAGEMVLKKLTSKPEIIYDGPIDSPEIADLVDQSFQHKEPVNYGSKHNLTATWNGQKVFIHPNYDTKSIEIAVPSNSWQFRKILEIKSIRDWRNFEKDAKIDYNNENAEIALSYFMHDMNWND